MTEYAKIHRPLKAIRLKCLDCMGGMHSEVKLCPIPECTLHPYRFGKRPETVSKTKTTKKAKKS